MVFSSVPVYLDPPNWQQQQSNHDHHQQQQGGRADHHHHQNTQLPPPPPPPQQPNQVGGGGAGSIRPGSMADRARMAKLPQPETALKCPRCDSANTKFCYFNNYSLSQPRHFCKTCRRYWTRGGALRNVPVGGGCRRNKRSKSSSRSKSPGSAAAASSDRQTGACASTSAATMSSNGGDILGHLAPPPHLPFLPALHHLGTDHYGAGSSDIGLNFGGIPLPQVMATGGGGGSGTDVEYLPTGLAEQWRLQQQVQQFPFLANLEAPPNTGSGLYPFDHHHHHHHHHQHQHQNHHENVEPPGYGRSKPLDSGVSGVVSQMASVKVEGLSNNNNNNNQGLNIMSRNFLGALGNHNDHQYNLGGGTGTAAANNAWTDLSTFSTTSSTNHLL